MKSLALSLLASAALVGSVQAQTTQPAPNQTPASWTYSIVNGGKSQAVYNGDVIINGDCHYNVSTPCSGGGSGVISFNTRNGVVTLLSADVTAASGALLTGTPTAGHCVEWFSATTVEDAGSACGAGSGPSTNQNTRSITFVIAGGGSPITTGVQGKLIVPFACTIGNWTILADQTGSIVVDLWKSTYVHNTPPTITNTITGSAKPTLSGELDHQSSTLTGWTTSVAANDEILYDVVSAASITQATVSLSCVASS